jgi:large subunit ribosomal protein L15
MKLNQLRNRPGSTHTPKLLGRGIGSGLGKTSGRGVKGQKARTGVAIKGFEGGQMPLFRRLPKRGFTSIGRVKYVAVNVGRLQGAVDAKRIDPAQKVTVDVLVDAGVIRRAYEGMRLLGDGELKAKLTIEAIHASETARAAVEKAGGTIAIIAKVKAETPAKEGKKAKAKKAEKPQATA